jgi:alcohol dehydrogenase class IV
MQYPAVSFESFFSWVNRPRIMYSPGLRREVGYEMEQLGGARAILITDKGLVNAGVSGMVAEELKKSKVELVGIFDRILQDARLDLIDEGAEFYRGCAADCMIAVGGGSVMDTAKAVNILIGSDLKNFRPLAEQAALWDGAKPLPPHIAFPTTAGTGCEVTNAMVVLDMEAKVKLQVTHPYCNPDVAMLDPELTLGLPGKITAFTGMDALTHAIEGVTSTNAQPISDALGLHAIRLICRYLPLAVNEPGNLEARGHMLIASTLAGMCFVNAMTGGVHALAHSLGARYGIPHGLANSIMLPVVMAFNLEEAPMRYLMVADALGIALEGRDSREMVKQTVQVVQELRKTIGLTETLKDLGVPGSREELQPMIELAAGDGQISYNPRTIEDDDIFQLYLNAR